MKWTRVTGVNANEKTILICDDNTTMIFFLPWNQLLWSTSLYSLHILMSVLSTCPITPSKPSSISPNMTHHSKHPIIWAHGRSHAIKSASSLTSLLLQFHYNALENKVLPCFKRRSKNVRKRYLGLSLNGRLQGARNSPVDQACALMVGQTSK